jgi:methoxymalonate biosynthesis acyl carrier protein
MNEHKTKIRNFFARFVRTTHLKDTDDIFAQGFVNSLFAMQLVAWLEKEFGIAINDEDLDIANFNSIEAIARLINRKVETAVGA